MAKNKKNEYSKSIFSLIFVIVVNLVIHGITFLRMFSILLIVMLIIGGIRTMFNRRSKQKELAAAKRIQQLKEHIRQTDTGIKHLEQLQKDGEISQYLTIAEQVLPALDHIQSETERLKNNLDTNIYRRIRKHTQSVATTINKQVKNYQTIATDDTVDDFETILREQAPELIKTYQNIQRDDKVILEKIKKADNKEELLALHQTGMERFEDVLRGYLKIKASPKDFYNAQERLEQAKTAMEQFDLDLDETLRQLNENDMTDFDISLRMMRDKL